LDHRGHGKGLRPEDGIVRLSDCADDAAEVLGALEVDRAVVVGYSMGGAIAQLLWRRHPDKVAGLVLASTARHFKGGPLSELWYRGYTPLAMAAHLAEGPAERLVQWRVERRVRDEPQGEWMRRELEQASPAGILSSMRSLGRFSSVDWLDQLDVPTSVIVTTKDRTIPALAQDRLAAAIPDSRRFAVDGPHDAVVTAREAYLPVLGEAIAHAAST
jgi:3-oxoadipate enol-lactonase